VYKPVRVGLAIAGLEVPHAHVHETPIETIDDLNCTRAATTIPSDLDQQAAKIAAALL
jgi:histidine triad (HIT) family protein